MIKFAFFEILYYYDFMLAKSGIGIRTPLFENRQSVSLVYGGLLGAAHVAGRFCFRGSSNPGSSATNSFEPVDGAKQTKKTGRAMGTCSLLFILSLLKRQYLQIARLLISAVIYHIEFSKAESFIDNFSAINFVLSGENNVASQA